MIQDIIRRWTARVFGYDSAHDAPERSLRVAEESIELTQSLGVDVATVHKLVDYVYGRPAGEPSIEMAQVAVTLYACAAARHLDLDALVLGEIERIHSNAVEARCAGRQAEKREALR